MLHRSKSSLTSRYVSPTHSYISSLAALEPVIYIFPVAKVELLLPWSRPLALQSLLAIQNPSLDFGRPFILPLV